MEFISFFFSPLQCSNIEEKTMEITTLLEYSERSQLRAWLQENHSKEKECRVVMSHAGKFLANLQDGAPV